VRETAKQIPSLRYGMTTKGQLRKQKQPQVLRLAALAHEGTIHCGFDCGHKGLIVVSERSWCGFKKVEAATGAASASMLG
jgi:hypothetical protein